MCHTGCQKRLRNLNSHTRAAARVPFPQLSHFRKNFWQSVYTDCPQDVPPKGAGSISRTREIGRIDPNSLLPVRGSHPLLSRFPTFLIFPNHLQPGIRIFYPQNHNFNILIINDLHHIHLPPSRHPSSGLIFFLIFCRFFLPAPTYRAFMCTKPVNSQIQRVPY